MMFTALKIALLAALSLLAGGSAAGQTSYHVVSLSNRVRLRGPLMVGAAPTFTYLPIIKTYRFVILNRAKCENWSV